jgi:hypothetical protein
VQEAHRAGVGRGRLNGPDLARPFPGIRVRAPNPPTSAPAEDPYLLQRRARVEAATVYAHRMPVNQHISHESAAALWGAPLPLAFTPDRRIARARNLPVHVTAMGTAPLPRVVGVQRHRGRPDRTFTTEQGGIRLSTPATTWASLGTLPFFDLVTLGDYFCRVWRPGRGRPTPGRSPLATIEELRAATRAGRRVGIQKLREAVEWIREDSWSPRESRVRCVLRDAGLPEPELNVDMYEDGAFLGCGDIVFRERRILVEYHGMLHGATWAADVERTAAFRAAGWTVIDVTAPLLADPDELVRRVRRALQQP